MSKGASRGGPLHSFGDSPVTGGQFRNTEASGGKPLKPTDE
jgi:hypothetical protein